MLSFAGVATWSGLAGAQYFHAEPAVRVLGGYTFSKIVFDTRGMAPTVTSEPILTLAPGLLLTYATPRVTNVLTIASTIGLPITKDISFENPATTFNLGLTYLGTIPLNERTQLTLTGASTATRLSGVSTPSDAASTVSLTDFSYNFAVTGGETILRQLAPDSTLTQTTGVLYNFPLSGADRPTTLTVTNSLALAHMWTRDTLALTGSTAVARFGEDTATAMAPRTEVLNNLSLRWGHPFTEALSSSLSVGVGQTISPGTAIGQVWQPTGGAQLTYSLTSAEIGFLYNYTAIVNVFTATTNLTNQIALRSLVRIADTGLSMTSSVGFLRAIPIGDVGVPLDTFTTDVVLVYSPIQLPWLLFNVRGFSARQIPIGPSTDPTIVASRRYGISLNAGFSYPPPGGAAVREHVMPDYTPAAILDGEGVGVDETPTAEGQSE
jgi:hypothetical protein